MSPSTPHPLPERTRRYLADPCLTPLWAAARTKLERGRLAVTGTVTVTLDEDGAGKLAGLLGKPVTAGRARVSLTTLDQALRKSAAAAGLVTVVEQLTGGELVDRAAAREKTRASWAGIWQQLDAALGAAGLAGADWTPVFVEGVRRSGMLTRAGVDAATTVVPQFAAVLRECAAAGAFEATVVPHADWELAELAGRCLGDAHGLDDGKLTASLLLRAAAAAFGIATPETAEERCNLWTRLGVTPDLVSGTALVLNLSPPGPGPWPEMMRARTDMGLMTHLTLHELRGAATGVRLATPGTQVFACENPQVLQAAARAGVSVPMLCLAGNPSLAGWQTLRRLVHDGARVLYHGDFDWPGVAIATRLFAVGAEPWRMRTGDYLAAVATLPPDSVLTLTGTPAPTPWEPNLTEAMRRQNLAIHEETLMPILLTDLSVNETAWSLP
ncbi:TIGR02679 family protein [Nonomuraea sp. NPDC050783]|uniref:TIGR02679 family protein n=1 Tax=Nonomuraea sp. NPDC050783 TaxID=3154634 RepID=UPI00346728D0